MSETERWMAMIAPGIVLSMPYESIFGTPSAEPIEIFGAYWTGSAWRRLGEEDASERNRD
ncbi:MAG: hypothetical protein M0R22_10905 [Dehalococcoidia bacterium]|nr:hypothetical protein [Dehalococcoidia bacterium]